jgi:hypothetical protein
MPAFPFRALSRRRIGQRQRFSQGMRVKRRVELTVLALARLGHLASADDGETFMLRRAA